MVTVMFLLLYLFMQEPTVPLGKSLLGPHNPSGNGIQYMKPKHVACVEETTFFFVVDGIRLSIVNMMYHKGINYTNKRVRSARLPGIERRQCSRPPCSSVSLLTSQGF